MSSVATLLDPVTKENAENQGEKVRINASLKEYSFTSLIDFRVVGRGIPNGIRMVDTSRNELGSIVYHYVGTNKGMENIKAYWYSVIIDCRHCRAKDQIGSIECTGCGLNPIEKVDVEARIKLTPEEKEKHKEQLKAEREAKREAEKAAKEAAKAKEKEEKQAAKDKEKTDKLAAKEKEKADKLAAKEAEKAEKDKKKEEKKEQDKQNKTQAKEGAKMAATLTKKEGEANEKYLHKPQAVILAYLSKCGEPQTNKEIAAGTKVHVQAMSRHIGTENKESRELSDKKYGKSLITLKAVSVHPSEERSLRFAITEKGRELLIKYLEGNGIQLDEVKKDERPGYHSEATKDAISVSKRMADSGRRGGDELGD